MANNIESKGIGVFQYAMHFGVHLGFYLILSQVFYIGQVSFGISWFANMHFFFFFGFIVFVYKLMDKYRYLNVHRQVGVSEYILVSVLFCFFASFFVCLIVFIHIKFIDPSYFDAVRHGLQRAITKSLSQSNPTWLKNNPVDFDRLGNIVYLYYLILQVISYVVVGFILGIIFGIILSIRKKK